MTGTLALVHDATALPQSHEHVATPRRFGSVRRMRSGRWQARYRCPSCDHLHPGHTTFDTEGMAEAHLAGIRSDVMRDRYVCLVARKRLQAEQQRVEAAERAAEVTFGEYAARWLARRSERLKPRTVMLYRRQLETDLVPGLGEVPLTALDVTVVDEWWGALTAKHPRRKVANVHVYGLLKSIMNGAVRDRMQPRVTVNPCQVESEELTRPKRKQNDPATPAELRAIAEAMPDRLALAVWLAAYSGLRFGELAELRRRDLDTTDAEPALDVKRAVIHREGLTIVGEPKSNAGVRTVYLPGFLRDPLLRHMEAHAQPGPDGLLFTGPRMSRRTCGCGYIGCQGAHLFNGALHRAYDSAREVAGRPDLRWHDLRHTGLTQAARNGATLAELQARAGHSTPVMAMHYQRATQERDRELARRMSATYEAEQV